MTRRYFPIPSLAALCLLATPAGFARDAETAPQFRASDVLPMVPAAAPGVYSEQKNGSLSYHIAVQGQHFTSRGEIEKYLAYRAAELAKGQKAAWFTLSEARTKEDAVAAPKPEQAYVTPSATSDRSLAFLVPTPDRASKPYSFRLEYWRPLWRYKLANDADWKTWSPFSGAPFFAATVDTKKITQFEVTADIRLHNGQMDYYNPLAFEAWAVADFLINQVLPPT